MTEMNELLNATFKLKAAEATMSQYRVAVLDTDTEGQVTNPAGASAANIAGVLRDSTLEAGKVGNFQVAGIAKVEISASVSVGDILIVGDTSGRVKPKGTGAHNSGVGIVGRAISANSTSGNIVKCILCIPSEYSS